MTTNAVVRALVSVALVASAAFSTEAAKAVDFQQLAYQADAAVLQGLTACGLEAVDAFDPRLPRPQVYSDISYVNWSRARVAGHRYHSDYVFGYGGNALSYYFVNGYTLGAADAYANDGGLAFNTDVGGTVAYVTTYLTPAGRGFLFYCRSVPVTEQDFLRCVQARFVDRIVGGLCGI